MRREHIAHNAANKSKRPNNGAAANPAMPLSLQSDALVGRVAELGSLAQEPSRVDAHQD
jgi:hypothetical protein